MRLAAEEQGERRWSRGGGGDERDGTGGKLEGGCMEVWERRWRSTCSGGNSWSIGRCGVIARILFGVIEK